MMARAWISPKEAADLLDYTEDYFRREWCDTEHPKVTIWEKRGPRGGRRIQVLRIEIEAIIDKQTKRGA